ncbi:hypothetical protein [Streptomyces sp. B21-083]|uniref:hypothetical protein n=1 Tax=Streptomyces sp. B21-083 TaxID=3039410 RepID=UPI002FF3F885
MHGERLGGARRFEYRFSSDTGCTRTTDSTATWTPPASGSYTFTVRAVDYYGYGGRTGPATTMQFKVS